MFGQALIFFISLKSLSLPEGLPIDRGIFFITMASINRKEGGARDLKHASLRSSPTIRFRFRLSFGPKILTSIFSSVVQTSTYALSYV